MQPKDDDEYNPGDGDRLEDESSADDEDWSDSDSSMEIAGRQKDGQPQPKKLRTELVLEKSRRQGHW